MPGGSSLFLPSFSFLLTKLCEIRHYVAFIRKFIPRDRHEGGKEEGEEAWVLFNDEKVVKAEGDVDEMKKFAYVYFFERV